MKYLTILLLLTFSGWTLADQSSITESDGASCMGDDKSRKQTETVALQEAKRLAVEFSTTHIQSETVVENFELKNDLVKAFAAAKVQVLEVLDERWDDPTTGDCYNIRIKAEIRPAKADMDKVDSNSLMGNPRTPLNVKLWTNADQYQRGEAMKIYLQGNKPFYGRLVYVNADGDTLQLLPNQHRRDNYFAGATMFEIPTDQDRFDLTVVEPFGKEKLILYASTSQLGNIDMSAYGDDVYLVNEPTEEKIAAKTRGISITKAGSSAKKVVVEFSETAVEVVTQDVE